MFGPATLKVNTWAIYRISSNGKLPKSRGVMAAIKFSNFLPTITDSSDIDIDQRIASNIKQFKRTVSRRAIKNYSRPIHWSEKIEIVVPCYNHGAYLKSAFRSIVAQTRKEPT